MGIFSHFLSWTRPLLITTGEHYKKQHSGMMLSMFLFLHSFAQNIIQNRNLYWTPMNWQHSELWLCYPCQISNGITSPLNVMVVFSRYCIFSFFKSIRKYVFVVKRVGIMHHKSIVPQRLVEQFICRYFAITPEKCAAAFL